MSNMPPSLSRDWWTLLCIWRANRSKYIKLVFNVMSWLQNMGVYLQMWANILAYWASVINWWLLIQRSATTKNRAPLRRLDLNFLPGVIVLIQAKHFMVVTLVHSKQASERMGKEERGREGERTTCQNVKANHSVRCDSSSPAKERWILSRDIWIISEDLQNRCLEYILKGFWLLLLVSNVNMSI